MVPEIFMFENLFLDAVLFVLLTVRYLWGSATDMLRMILFVFAAYAVFSDLNIYYGWHVPWLTFSIAERQVFGKAVIGLFLVADLLKDYLEIRRRDYVRNLISTAKGG